MSETLITPQTTLTALADHVGAAAGVDAEALVVEITGTCDQIEAGKRRLRHVVEDLRAEGHHICAWPRAGYFIAATDDELNTSCQYLYSRAMASLQKVAAMKRVSVPDLRGQMRLPS
ncbi:hypothetical protein [Salinisphaera orenii]|uniref:hypothetical protein n=1 Tax=Salinisphaera orenii TaxID=856731 RepID=UPI000DBE54F2